MIVEGNALFLKGLMDILGRKVCCDPISFMTASYGDGEGREIEFPWIGQIDSEMSVLIDSFLLIGV